MEMYQTIDARRKAVLDRLNSNRSLDHAINSQLSDQNSELEQRTHPSSLVSTTKELEKFELRLNKDEGIDYPISNHVNKNDVPHSSPHLTPLKTHLRASPLDVTSVWLIQNISNVECIREFIIVTDPPMSSYVTSVI